MSAGAFGEMLRVLVWKHSVVRRRRFLHSAIELISPALLFIMFFFLYGNFAPTQTKDRRQHSEIMERVNVLPGKLHQIFYTPPSEKADSLIGMARERLDIPTNVNGEPSEALKFPGVWSYSDQSQLKQYMRETSSPLEFAVVIFKDLDGVTLPNKLHYTIRVSEDLQTGTYETGPGYHEKFGEDYENFVALQWAIDTAYIKLRSGTNVEQSLSAQHFPKPAALDDYATARTLSALLKACTTLSPLTFFLFQVSRLVEERFSGIQELMHMMGVPLRYMQASHVVNGAGAWLVYVASGTLLTARFLPPSSWLPFAALLFLYFAYIIVLAFFCSTLLNTENHAVSLALTVFVLTLWLADYVNHRLHNTHRLLLLLSGLLPHVPVLWFWCNISDAIQFGEGVTWSSAITMPINHSGPLVLALLMLLVQTVLLAAFTQYLSAVRPGKYGVAKRWDYLFHRQPENEKMWSEGVSWQGDPRYFEEPPRHPEVGISVRNVSKVYSEWRKPKKVILNNVSLDIYSGEITLLLGQNGAGKTTLMSIITGMYSATSGKVYMKGREVLSDGTQVRNSIGLCPQHNLAFNDLTVREHFIFFAMIYIPRWEQLKGVRRKAAVLASDELLEQLRLEDKAESISRQLSGGMQRRLQLGCALSGDPDVLVLDEPTSGLDVETRRKLWNLLLAVRGERTVLLSTHFMEEADALGDRVAALDGGHLRCYATPMFLKRAIGTGYRLSLTLEKQHDKEAVLKAVRSVLPRARVTESIPSAMVFSLSARDRKRFPKLFNTLEKRQQELHISTMGVGITTLEEVFLKLCSHESFEEDVDAEGYEENKADRPYCTRLTGSPLMKQQFAALLHRHLKYLWSRNPFFILTEILLPVAAILYFAHVLNQGFGADKEQPAVAMNLKMYREFGPSKVLYNMQLDGGEKALEPFRTQYQDMQFVSTSDVGGDILREGSTSMSDYYRLLLALELDTTSANALYSTTVRHAMPVAVNTLTNLLANVHLGQATDPYTITTINHPIKQKPTVKKEDINLPKSIISCYTWALCMAAFCATVLTPMIAVAVTERASSARHVRLMTGVPFGVYFGAMNLLHVSMFSLIGLPAVLVAAGTLDRDHTFDNSAFLGALLVIVLLHALAYTAFMYLLSYFTSESGAASILYMLVPLFTMVMPVVGLLTKQMSGYVWRTLISLSMVMPSYNLGIGLAKMTGTAYMNAFCHLNPNCIPCCETEHGPAPLNYLNLRSGAGQEIIIMFLQTGVFWVAVYLLERGVFNSWWDARRNRGYRPPEPHYRDPHVIAERDYVDRRLHTDGVRGTLGVDTALLSGVHKKYCPIIGRKHLAVRGVTLSVKHGECFGLLGVNGAGKSTVFNMLTVTEHATRGKICANGYDLACSRDKYLSTLTYCPQYGGLDGFMSGWDNVELMVRLRGVPEQYVRAEVASWIQSVDLDRLKLQRVCEYSGGCARRCATAAALAGVIGCLTPCPGYCSRRLALLDEPTAGVDPGARRRVWSALRRSQRAGLAVVISSHSMDETEALCDRIAIMSRGEVGALGSAAELRSEHAVGYTAQIKLRTPGPDHDLTSSDSTSDSTDSNDSSFDSTDNSVLGMPMNGRNNSARQEINKIKKAMHNSFKCVLKDEHETTLHYHIAEHIRYSELFRRMENIKKLFPDLVEDYTISGTTLEEVFLSFARDASEKPPEEV